MESSFSKPTRKLLATLVIVSTLLLLFLASPSADAQTPSGIAGKWDRLNPYQNNLTPEHEVLKCGGNANWHCVYDKKPEPHLGFETPPDSAFGRFQGVNISSEWTCPEWFPSSICDNTSFVVGGVMRYQSSDGPDLIVDHELILTENKGGQILYVYWVDQFVCPWYRSFSEALAANPFPLPFDGVNWPEPDCISAP